MVRDYFLQRKKAVLSKRDKSSSGRWDEKIKSLCEKINTREDYYTTSSCSGRILIMVDQEKKGRGLFEFVSHDLMNEKEFLNEVAHFVRIGGSKSQADFSSEKSIKMKNSNNKCSTDCNDVKNNLLINKKYLAKHPSEAGCGAKNIRANDNERAVLKSNLKFKSEPPIIHIACETLDDANKFLRIAQNAGWKKYGVISLGKNIVVELIGSEKLEFPLVRNGKLLVDENFLGIVVEKANENLKRGWEKLKELEKLI